MTAVYLTDKVVSRYSVAGLSNRGILNCLSESIGNLSYQDLDQTQHNSYSNIDDHTMMNYVTRFIVFRI